MPVTPPSEKRGTREQAMWVRDLRHMRSQALSGFQERSPVALTGGRKAEALPDASLLTSPHCGATLAACCSEQCWWNTILCKGQQSLSRPAPCHPLRSHALKALSRTVSAVLRKPTPQDSFLFFFFSLPYSFIFDILSMSFARPR